MTKVSRLDVLQTLTKSLQLQRTLLFGGVELQNIENGKGTKRGSKWLGEVQMCWNEF